MCSLWIILSEFKFRWKKENWYLKLFFDTWFVLVFLSLTAFRKAAFLGFFGVAGGTWKEFTNGRWHITKEKDVLKKRSRNRKKMLRSRRRCKSGSCLDFLRIYDKHFSRLVKGRTEQNSYSKTESPLKRHKSNFFHISLRVVEDAIWSLISIYISIWRICYCFWRRRAAILEHKKIKGRL